VAVAARRRRCRRHSAAGQERREKLAEETDDLLDEIDDVLEEKRGGLCPCVRPKGRTVTWSFSDLCAHQFGTFRNTCRKSILIC